MGGGGGGECESKQFGATNSKPFRCLWRQAPAVLRVLDGPLCEHLPPLCGIVAHVVPEFS